MGTWAEPKRAAVAGAVTLNGPTPLWAATLPPRAVVLSAVLLAMIGAVLGAVTASGLMPHIDGGSGGWGGGPGGAAGPPGGPTPWTYGRRPARPVEPPRPARRAVSRRGLPTRGGW